MPRPFLRKLLQMLQVHGVLSSAKGAGGGFSLKKPAHKIYLTEVRSIFQGPLQINECLFKKKLCPNRAACKLKNTIENIEEKVIAELGAVTIASLLE
jgi:Rrf2 family protein